MIKTEPCFKVIATEDQATKQFYQNKPKKQETASLIEADSLDEEYPFQLNVSYYKTNKDVLFIIDSFRKKKKKNLLRFSTFKNLLLIE